MQSIARMLAVVGVCFIAIPLVSLASLIAANSDLQSMSDFGINCQPSTITLTVLYVAASVFGQMIVGTSAALLTYFVADGRASRLIALIAIFTIPYAVPSTIGFTLWEFGLAEGGTLQELLFPGGSPLDGAWARFWVMVALSIWQFFPFVFLLMLAAFLSVPRQMLLEAQLEGANDVRLTKDFLLPIAAPVFVSALFLRVILMATKLDTPLAFHMTSSSDFACIASVRIYSSLGFAGNSIPFGLVTLLALTVLIALVARSFFRRCFQ